MLKCWFPFNFTSGDGCLCCSLAVLRPSKRSWRDESCESVACRLLSGFNRTEPGGLATIAAELPQIRRAWEAVSDNDELVLAFALAIHWFHDVQGMWQEAIRWKTRGAQAARALKREESEGAGDP